MHGNNPPYTHRLAVISSVGQPVVLFLIRVPLSQGLESGDVLQDQKGNWVLCDFGSATTRAQVYETPAEIAVEENVIMKKTTPTYRAPEVPSRSLHRPATLSLATRQL